MNIDRDELIRLTTEYGGAWGINHAQRLLHLIGVIGAGQAYDPEIVWVAAHLHDWGGYSPWAQAGVDHALRSKQVAEPFLTERNYPADFKARVLECIEFHHSGDPNRSTESILLSDADALDFLGVVGIMRDCAKSPKDLRGAVETIRKRRGKLANMLHLDRSKTMAAKRIKEMDEALAAFEEETAGWY